MENDIKVRKVTQDVVLFVWFRSEIITKKPSPELCNIPDISGELINNLSIAVYGKTVRKVFEWEHFLSNHFKRMASSNSRFANYVAYGFGVSSKTKDAYDNFIEALSLVNFLSLFCWEQGYKRFINTSVELFCSFFEKNIRSMFEKRGGWEHFNEYLEERYDLDTKRHVIRSNNSSEHWNNFRDEMEQIYYQNLVISDSGVGNVSRSDVETDKQAITFAESIADKIDELCGKEIDELLAEFAVIDSLVKVVYRSNGEETSVETARELETFLSQKNQKEASQNIPSKCKPERNHFKQTVLPSDTLEVTHSSNINSKDAVTSDEELINNRILKRSERIRNLLNDISMDIKNLSGIKKSLCKEHVAQVQEKEGSSK